MLIKCPECELQVSDKAYACPHCGYPLKEKPKPIRKKSNKRRRLPNGFGQISEIKGRGLRKPFRAMVTVGKNDEGRPIVKPLKPESYFATYNEAYEALVEYNRNPYDLSDSITMKELYERWLPEYCKRSKSKTTRYNADTAWKYCSDVYKMRVVDIRQRHIKGCMENGTVVKNGEERHPTLIVQYRIKTLFNQMLDYALEYDIVQKNYARTFSPSKEILDAVNNPKDGHINYTDAEMEILWNNVDKNRYASIVIIQCYSGWRPQELGLIRLENVDLDHWMFKGGIKTEAGIDRTVPIHSRIRPLVKKWYDNSLSAGCEYLFNYKHARRYNEGEYMSYDKFRRRYREMVNELGLNPEHKSHDGRVQFVTMAKNAKVDDYALKYMVGHAISDITEKTYTKREDSWLAEEIEKIK